MNNISKSLDFLLGLDDFFGHVVFRLVDFLHCAPVLDFTFAPDQETYVLVKIRSLHHLHLQSCLVRKILM
jgi:hypothetical protein